MMKSIRRAYILQFVYILFCTIGCIYQLITITEIYLSYMTTTMVNVQFPESFILPAVTICIWNKFFGINVSGTTAQEAFDSGFKIDKYMTICKIMDKDCKHINVSKKI